jgi:hypothetical protein
MASSAFHTQFSNIPLFHHSMWFTGENGHKENYNSNKLQKFQYFILAVFLFQVNAVFKREHRWDVNAAANLTA